MFLLLMYECSSLDMFPNLFSGSRNFLLVSGGRMCAIQLPSHRIYPMFVFVFDPSDFFTFKCSFPRTSIRASLHVCQVVARLGLGAPGLSLNKQGNDNQPVAVYIQKNKKQICPSAVARMEISHPAILLLVSFALHVLHKAAN